MQPLILHSSTLAQWYYIITEAEAASACFLDEDLQSYLAYLMMRFTKQPQIASRIIALEYVEALEQQGHQQHDKLRNVADTCLLYSGLFPRLATRRRVSRDYFAQIGCSAYDTLSAYPQHSGAQLYGRLSSAFLTLTHILQNMNNLNLDLSVVNPAGKSLNTLNIKH